MTILLLLLSYLLLNLLGGSKASSLNASRMAPIKGGAPCVSILTLVSFDRDKERMKPFVTPLRGGGGATTSLPEVANLGPIFHLFYCGSVEDSFNPHTKKKSICTLF